MYVHMHGHSTKYEVWSTVLQANLLYMHTENLALCHGGSVLQDDFPLGGPEGFLAAVGSSKERPTVTFGGG